MLTSGSSPGTRIDRFDRPAAHAAIDLAPNIPEPSGLAFNRKNNTLMVVSDAKSDIFEIDFSGSIKNKIATTSTDLEGVAITQNGDTLYVVEERNQRVVSYAKNGQRLNSISVRVATSDNSALEGIAIDNRRHLFVLNEKSPRLLLEFVGSAEVSRKEITAVKDLSGICYDESNEVCGSSAMSPKRSSRFPKPVFCWESGWSPLIKVKESLLPTARCILSMTTTANSMYSMSRVE
jgi:hypothetical protein